MSKEWVTVRPEDFFDVDFGTASVKGRWPGFENVRVQVFREVEPGMPQLHDYDGVKVDGVDNQGVPVFCRGVVIGIKDNWVTIATTAGVQKCVPLSAIKAVIRNLEDVYPPQANAISSTE